MKTGMKSFVLVSIILAFFVFNLSDCKGKKEEETQIKQKAVKAMEEVKKAEPEAEEISQKEGQEKVKEEVVKTKVEEKAEKAEHILKEEVKEELLPPKLIWEKVVETKKLIFKQELHFVDEKVKAKLISEKSELSKFLANENLYPFILLKGKSKQYLFGGKGNLKEIAYPTTDLVSEHSYDAFGEFTIKRRNSEVLWKKTVGGDIDKDGYWDEFFNTVLFSPDRSWLVIYYASNLNPPEYFTHIAFDIDGNKFWEHTSIGQNIFRRAIFSEDNKYLYFSKNLKLMKADKKEVLWEAEVGDVHGLIISKSGKYIFGHGYDILDSYNIFLLDNKGKILWKKYTQNMGVSFEVCAFDENEKYIFAVGTKGEKFSILSVSDAKVIKNIPWCSPGSSIYKRLWGFPSSLKATNSKIVLSISSSGVRKEGDLFVALYDISHLTKKEN